MFCRLWGFFSLSPISISVHFYNVTLANNFRIHLSFLSGQNILRQIKEALSGRTRAHCLSPRRPGWSDHEDYNQRIYDKQVCFLMCTGVLSWLVVTETFSSLAWTHNDIYIFVSNCRKYAIVVGKLHWWRNRPHPGVDPAVQLKEMCHWVSAIFLKGWKTCLLLSLDSKLIVHFVIEDYIYI